MNNDNKLNSNSLKTETQQSLNITVPEENSQSQPTKPSINKLIAKKITKICKERNANNILDKIIIVDASSINAEKSIALKDWNKPSQESNSKKNGEK